jgi:hypothetical protein
MNIFDVEKLDKNDHRYFLEPSTWYNVFKIVDMSGKEFIDFDTTINGSNIFTPYLECERVCTIRTDYLGNIIPFVQVDNTFYIDWQNEC